MLVGDDMPLVIDHEPRARGEFVRHHLRAREGEGGEKGDEEGEAAHVTLGGGVYGSVW